MKYLKIFIIISGFFLFNNKVFAIGLGEKLNEQALNSQVKLLSQNNKFTKYSEVTSITKFTYYIDSKNRVFAIAWNGKFMPNLKLVLADYYPQFKNLVSQKPHFHSLHLSQIENNNFIFQQYGITQNIHGIAILKTSISEGVIPSEIN